MLESAPPSELVYPLSAEPQTGDGSAIVVAPGVLWLRMPLFAALPWINVWAIADGDGWSIVDTGIKSADTIDAWHTAFSQTLGAAPVTRVIVTHMHPDHCGMAGWIAERFKTRLWMSRLEYLSCRLMAADTGRCAPADAVAFYRAAGWDEEALERYKAKFGSFGEMIYPLPASYRRLEDGDALRIGAHEWRVVVGSGHSPEHACLYCPELGLLISGDQVLPRISSNVSVYPTEPDGNPLDDWLKSLAAIKRRIPDDVLVLPAHNSPFKGLHARIDELTRSHRDSLARLERVLVQPQRAVDVFGALFARPIKAGVLGMATGEAVAHLNYLWHAGRATRELDDGIWWWQRSA
ncbi:MAG TPA: MBL fold metallo-hydrolase [Steroidobacteraceae bacterium]|nr:MBL fold metallo-hydrolase [Steroidobacteraceae bacterium]